MIFLGDIASPTSETSNDFYESLKRSMHVFENDWVVANFEGLISEVYYKTDTPILSNHPSIVKSLKLINTTAVSLANNHTLDLPQNYKITTELLSQNKIGYCGAGIDIEEAEKPLEIIHQKQKYFILGYSWDILMQHQKNTPGIMYVNIINPQEIIKKIKSIRAENPESKIVLNMHWNFDLEKIPFPLHRKFSQAMIDAGANAIIGNHSHCVQGGERYKNGIIIYGLGNFFFPWHIYRNGNSYFPDWTRTQLALQWDPETNEAICHWFKYNINEGKHELEFLKSENFDTGPLIREYSPYRGMDDIAYTEFYKNNRTKGFMIPTYRDHNEVFRNKLIDFYLKNRIKFARFLTYNKVIRQKR